VSQQDIGTRTPDDDEDNEDSADLEGLQPDEVEALSTEFALGTTAKKLLVTRGMSLNELVASSNKKPTLRR
jgi:hypothetical protein